MSFLAGRLAATEGAYFLQESKHAVDRIIQKNNNKNNFPPPPAAAAAPQVEGEVEADVLHSVLRHSLPSNILRPQSDSSLTRFSKWILPHDPSKIYSLSTDALNPLRAYVSLPQITLGPKRWKLPEGENSVIASTANELRPDRYTPSLNSNKLNAAAEIGNPFIIATATVFGGSALVFGLVVSNLDIHSRDAIKNKGTEMLQPKIDSVKEQLIPLQIWVKNVSEKLHYKREGDTQNGLIENLSKRFRS